VLRGDLRGLAVAAFMRRQGSSLSGHTTVEFGSSEARLQRLDPCVPAQNQQRERTDRYHDPMGYKVFPTLWNWLTFEFLFLVFFWGFLAAGGCRWCGE
jgi:hypothetical protein